jgi:chorismate synthase
VANSIGKFFIITSFGESHGECIGVIVDGCPAGLALRQSDIQKEVDKRKPGAVGTTKRVEKDRVEIFSGVFNNITTGAPICLLLRNEDVDSYEYEKTIMQHRPGHADYTAFMKYGGFNDYRGGGRFSGRITAGFVMAGAIAKKLLNSIDIKVLAYTIEIGGIEAEPKCLDEIIKNVSKNDLRCADLKSAQDMDALIEEARRNGDSVGGIIRGMAINMPVGLGEPVFDTLEGDLAKALFAIPAVKGVEFGSGFIAARRKGSENNDAFIVKDGRVFTETNNSGGILGGISNGMPLELRVAIKPTASISKRQQAVNIEKMEVVDMSVVGRHDTCIVPRAVVVVEAMIAITLCDFSIRAGLLPRVIE